MRTAEVQKWDLNRKLTTATRPKASPQTLLDLYQAGPLKVQMAAVVNPNACVALLEHAAEHPEVSVRRRAAQHDNTEIRLLKLLVEDDDAEVLRITMMHANSDDDIIMRGIDRCYDIHERERYKPQDDAAEDQLRSVQGALVDIAMKEQSSTAVLKRIADGTCDTFRRPAHVFVAAHQNTDVDTLIELSQNLMPSVRAECAKNPKTPEDVLRGLAEDREMGVRRTIAARDTLMSEIACILCKDKEAEVRSTLASQDDLPQKAVDILARDKKSEVLRAIAGHPLLREADCQRFSESDDTEIRLSVADNKGTPPAILMMLAMDADDDVRQAATEMLAIHKREGNI